MFIKIVQNRVNIFVRSLCVQQKRFDVNPSITSGAMTYRCDRGMVALFASSRNHHLSSGERRGETAPAAATLVGRRGDYFHIIYAALNSKTLNYIYIYTVLVGSHPGQRGALLVLYIYMYTYSTGWVASRSARCAFGFS